MSKKKDGVFLDLIQRLLGPTLDVIDSDINESAKRILELQEYQYRLEKRVQALEDRILSLSDTRGRV